MKKIRHNNLLGSLGVKRVQLICCASFEERCTKLPFALSKRNWEKVLVFKNEEVPGVDENASNIISMFENSEEITISISNPTFTADKLLDAIGTAKIEGEKLVIDFTTFTHEHLLILVRCLKHLNVGLSQIIWIYCRVEEYSINESDSKKWLSKGVCDIRSVLGYSGSVSPALPTCLLILVGFEADRAKRVIEMIEPNSLLLGKGASGKSESEQMQFINAKFHKLICDEQKSFDSLNVEEFEFACNDYEEVSKLITDKAKLYKNKANLVVVPMNTKLSTLAIANAYDENPCFQVVYSQAEVYNTEGYSKPTDSCYVLEDLFE